MLNTKYVFAVSLAICSGLAAQQKSASFSRTLGSTQVLSSVDLDASASHTTPYAQTYALTDLSNTAKFAIGGSAMETGMRVFALAHGTRSTGGSLDTVNWYGVRRGDVWIHMNQIGNSTYKLGFSAGTVTDRNRTFTVGSYTVAAKIRISAGASISLTHTSYSNRFGQAAYLSGSTRTYMDGSVWAVAGLNGATATMVSTLDMHDTTMGVDLSAGAVTTEGTMSYSVKSAKLYMFLRARRFWWQSYATRLILNTYSAATSGVRNLL